MSLKKSGFNASTTVPSSATLDYVYNGVNTKITFANFVSNLGVTGTIVQDGAVTGTPVLDTAGSVNNIRNLEDGAGVTASVSAENGITLSHSFVQDTTGLPILLNATDLTPDLISLTGSGGITLTATDKVIDISGTTEGFSSQVIVKQASDLSGALDSTKEYVIDGVIDMGATQITVPQGGLNLKGFSFDISKLTSSESSYTMFVSPAGGSGNVVLSDMAFEVTGASSKLFDIVSDTGFEAVEINAVNFNDCTDLGVIDNYRQGLELGTGRFGGTPSLEMKGAWLGGYRITTSIARSIDNAMTAPIFKAGAGLVISTRFLTDLNIDLGTTAPLTDFAPSNFANPSSFQVRGAIVTRGGTPDPTDSTVTPNITASDLEASWDDNIGIGNTFEGGESEITTETATTISVIGAAVDVAGTFTASDLQHFDAPANGQLRHLGNTPREYRVSVDFSVAGTSAEQIKLLIVKWDDSASSFVEIATQTREINNFVGSRDIAFFNMLKTVVLDQNDYIKIQVANMTSTNNVTAELGDSFVVFAR